MALNSLGLGFTFTAKDLATPTMNKVDKTFRRLDRSTGKASANLQAGFGSVRNAGLVVGIAGGVALRGMLGAADAAGKFGQKMVAVQKIGNATNEELETLRKKAIEVGLETKFSPQQIAEGFEVLASKGIAVNDQLKLIKPSAQLATAGQISLVEATAAVTGTMRSFGIEASRSTEIADKLTKITQITSLQAGDFATGLGKAAAAAGTFNQDLDETLVALGALRNANIDASSSSTAVREAFRRIGSDKRAQKTLKGLGIALDNVDGSARSSIDIIFELEKATQGMISSKQKQKVVEVLGARGLLLFNAATKLQTKVMRDGKEVTLSNAEAFAELVNQTRDSEGANADFVKSMNDTFEGQKQILKGAIETLKVVVGEAFLKVLFPILQKGVVRLTELIQKFQDLPDSTKEMIAKLALAAAAFATVGGASTALLGQLGQASIGFRAVGPAIAALGSAILPIMAALAAVTGAVLLFRFAWEQNLGGIRDVLGPIVDKVKLFFGALKQMFTQGFLSGDVLEDIQQVENEGVLRLLGAVVRLGFRLKRFAEGAGEGFMKVIRAMGPTIDKLFTSFGKLSKAIGITGKDVGDFASGPSSDFLESGKEIGEFFGNLVDIIVEAVAIYITTWASAIESFKAGLDFIRPGFEEFGNTIGQISDALNELVTELGFTGDAGDALGTIFEVVGTIIGAVWTGIVAGITIAAIAMGKLFAFMIIVTTTLVKGFTIAKDEIVSVWEGVVTFFEKIASGISGAIESMITTLVQIGSAIPDRFLPDDVKAFIKERTEGVGIEIEVPDSIGARSIHDRGPSIPTIGDPTRKEVEAEAGLAGVNDLESLAALIAKQLKDGIRVEVNVDGDKLAESTLEGIRSNNAAAFGATPGLGE